MTLPCHPRVPPRRVGFRGIVWPRQSCCGAMPAICSPVLPASHHLRLSDLRDQLGDNVEMANESEIDPLFPDCAHGAVPPLGHCYALPLIVDDSIEAQPEIYMESGDHETLLHIDHAQFARLMGKARHGRFSEKLPHRISSSVVWG